jgi:hypothetical protein
MSGRARASPRTSPPRGASSRVVALAERRADAALEHEYERLRGRVYRAVRGRLAKQRLTLDDDDLAGFYNQAWHGVQTKMLAGERIENLPGLLVSISY